MLKQKLADNIVAMLENEGYTTCRYTGCFDIAAKKNKLLLIKVLHNVDSILQDHSKNLKIVAKNLGGDPVIVGEQTTREKLQRGIVYERFETPTVSADTFNDLIIRGIFPRMYRDRGGLYVEIDSDILKDARSKKNMTQRELAEAVGINKKVIYEHEKHQIRMMLSIAEKLEDMLKKKIMKPADMFKDYDIKGTPKDPLEKAVGSELKKLGFEVDYAKYSPIDVFAKEKSLIVSDVETDRKKMKKKAEDLKRIASVTEHPAVLITDKKRKEIEGLTVLDRSELKEMEKSKELIKMLKKSK
ncbi:MAG: hypothetical protein GOV02_03435 [Candidatus Aenigmarchaeota archaeon]|nr:hypothetical protein [Candidatus Aenigmarchaeota archaeon]